MTDLRDAFRALRATPVVSAVAILSLALGIGANTAIFSLVNSLMLRSLPVKEPQQLVQVHGGADADVVEQSRCGSSCGSATASCSAARSPTRRSASTWRAAAKRSWSTASWPAAVLRRPRRSRDPRPHLHARERHPDGPGHRQPPGRRHQLRLLAAAVRRRRGRASARRSSSIGFPSPSSASRRRSSPASIRAPPTTSPSRSRRSR